MNKIFLLCFIYGVLFLISNSLVIVGKEISFNFHKVFGKSKKRGLVAYLERYLKVIAKDERVDLYAKILILLTVFLYCFFAIIFYQVLGFKGYIVAIGFAALPFIFVRVKVMLSQWSSSYEGELLIRELRDAYRMNDRNLYAAIDRVLITSGDKLPLSKKALLRLSLRLKSFKSATELKDILDDFVFSYNTEWAALLGQNIYNFVFEGIDINAGLDDMLYICKRINSKQEKQKAANTQASALTLFLSPLFFIVFGAMLFLMMDPREVMYIQFHTSTGLLCFIGIVGLLIANIIGALLCKKQKYDI